MPGFTAVPSTADRRRLGAFDELHAKAIAELHLAQHSNATARGHHVMLADTAMREAAVELASAYEANAALLHRDRTLLEWSIFHAVSLAVSAVIRFIDGDNPNAASTTCFQDVKVIEAAASILQTQVRGTLPATANTPVVGAVSMFITIMCVLAPDRRPSDAISSRIVGSSTAHVLEQRRRASTWAGLRAQLDGPPSFSGWCARFIAGDEQDPTINAVVQHLTFCVEEIELHLICKEIETRPEADARRFELGDDGAELILQLELTLRKATAQDRAVQRSRVAMAASRSANSAQELGHHARAGLHHGTASVPIAGDAMHPLLVAAMGDKPHQYWQREHARIAGGRI